jgi:methionyl-tRNA formyltransferase
MGNPPPPSSETDAPRLRVLFMGTPALAARVLESLIDAGQNDLAVVGVVTRPDQPRKRGLNLEPSEVATVAAQHGVRTLKPVKIRTTEFLDELRSFAPDVVVVAAYGRILPQAVLEVALPLNVHASLLPRHRGAAPVEGTLLAGDTITGVTIMRVTEQMDAGPILLQRSIPVADGETQGSLKKKLAALGADAVLEALHRLRLGALPEKPQDDKAATYTAPVRKEASVIDWRSDAARIERMVRAYDPWPVARTSAGGADLLLWRARVAPPVSGATAQPGTVVAIKPVPVVLCGDGFLELVEVQAPGRRRMPAADFLRGRQLAIGARLGT